MMAAEAGKDIYCEKPCGLTIEYCQRIDETIRKTDRVFQAGTQRRTVNHYQQAVQIAREGQLGRLTKLVASVYTPGHDNRWFPAEPTPDSSIRVYGGVNFVLIGVVIGAILMSASVNLGSILVGSTELAIANIARDLIFVVVGLVSLKMTPQAWREANGFSWAPILEVAKLFAGIFICMLPVLAMLKAGRDGAFAPLVAIVTNPDGSPNVAAYFWMTGVLSSFLDNAPTYLVFFNLAGGDPDVLMGALASTLAAISCGAVFMGANSYIGNAPNFMVKAVVEEAGIRMPSFFGYMAWSCGILVPLFVLLTVIFFR
jgi:Na+/H+ antiporter NhaD/arsenite permease-like protein